MSTNGKGLRSEALPSPSNGSMVIGRLSRPTYRVIRCAFDDLEGEIRRRDWYDLEHVTQQGDVYTLFFRLRDEHRKRED